MKKIGLKIHIWPDKILRTKCKEIKDVDGSIRSIFEEMCTLMREHKGVGLAANQAGLTLRLAVIEAEDKVFKLVNPVIIKKSGRIAILEGCLSFPGLELKVRRYGKIWVRSLNEKGEPLNLEVEDTLAIVFQHEIDHLDGICFIDRIPFWERLKIVPKLKAIKRFGKNEA